MTRHYHIAYTVTTMQHRIKTRQEIDAACAVEIRVKPTKDRTDWYIAAVCVGLCSFCLIVGAL